MEIYSKKKLSFITRHEYSSFMFVTTELLGVLVALWPRIHEVLSSNLGQDFRYSEIIRGFPQAVQANAGILPPLCNDHFLPNPLPLCSLDTNSVVT
jgi:hypothetical protein